MKQSPLSTMRQVPEEDMPVQAELQRQSKNVLTSITPGTQVNIEHAEGLAECKKILTLAKAGRMNGCLIEGMGCPGGCVAGAGTNIPIPTAKKDVAAYVKNSSRALPPKELEEIELK